MGNLWSLFTNTEQNNHQYQHQDHQNKNQDHQNNHQVHQNNHQNKRMVYEFKQKKRIIIGNIEIFYNLPENSAIEQFIIKVYNETSKQLSFYTFNKREDWFINENKHCSYVITIYGIDHNNKVLQEEFLRKQISGDTTKLSCKPYCNQEPRVDTIKCEVKEDVPWYNISHPLFILKDSPLRYMNLYVLILKDRKTKTNFIKIIRSCDKEISDPNIILKSRCVYDCELYKVDAIGKQLAVSGVVKSCPMFYYVPLELKTANSINDVEQLRAKAAQYIRMCGAYQVKYLYRNKPSYHPTIIESKSTGILKKYMKDNNGDPFSSINRNICGLHFSATPETMWGGLPSSSYFGDYRIMIPPEYLVKGNNLYFTDFFCMTKTHWVTLVLTKPGSDEDKFCQNRLVKLDIQNNPFFYKSGNGYKVTSLQVEILYTEDINLTEMRQKVGFQETKTLTCGRGSSKSDGVPKRPLCSLCNLPRN